MDSELMECQNCLRAYEVKNEQDGSVRLVAVWTGCKRTPSNAGMSDRDQGATDFELESTANFTPPCVVKPW